MWHKKPPEWFATETKTIFQISVSQLLLSVNLMSRLRTSTSVWRLCLVSKVEKEANFNNCNQILVICFQHLCDTYSNLSINMVFDKMGLYFASGKLKWTTENYVTLVVGAGADLGGCAWGVHPPPPRWPAAFYYNWYSPRKYVVSSGHLSVTSFLSGAPPPKKYPASAPDVTMTCRYWPNVKKPGSLPK